MPSLENHNKQYHLNAKEGALTAFTLSGAPYAKRHWQLAKGESTSRKWGHRIIAVIEAIPILGGIAALIDRISFTIKQHRSESRSLKDRNITHSSTSTTEEENSASRSESTSKSKTPSASRSSSSEEKEESPPPPSASETTSETPPSSSSSRVSEEAEEILEEIPLEDRDFIETQEDYNKYKAAQNGNREALYNLGMYLLNKQHPRASHYLELAAKKHHIEAKWHLALIELTKHGKKDYEKARDYLHSAADNGFAPAFAELGELYLKGLGGPKDERLAMKLFQMGADKNEPNACEALADLCQKKEPEKAFKLYQKAVEGGSKFAMYKLATCYEQGRGTNQNIQEAIRLYEMLLPENPRLQATIDRLKG